MYVLTIDQQGSTGGPDRVPEFLAALSGFTAGRGGEVIAFDRTVGDEVQGVFDDAGAVVDVVLHVLRHGRWSIGLGVGAVDLPLPAVSREASGQAFVHARAAVERAKGRTPAPVAVEGSRPERAREVEALLHLLAVVIARRTPRGWEVVDALARVGGSQKDVARRIGISEQAVSQRLHVAAWSQEAAVRPVVARLLGEVGA